MDRGGDIVYDRGESEAWAMNFRTDVFSAEPVGDGLLKIQGSGCVYCFLAIGTKRALLVDTMSGLGNLHSFVRTLTDLPLTVVCTHVHFDHIGGAMDFPVVWLPQEDSFLMMDHVGIDRRFGLEQKVCSFRHVPIHFSQGDFTPPGKTVWKHLPHGTIFDLGGRVLETISVPGHTPGSVGLLDSKTGCFISGDAGSRFTFMFLDCSTSVEVYLDALLNLKSHWGDRISCWLNAHNEAVLPPGILDDLIDCCHDALEGRVKGPLFREKDTQDWQFVHPIDKRWRRTDGKVGNVIIRRSSLSCLRSL